jgi:hypothetical protein
MRFEHRNEATDSVRLLYYLGSATPASLFSRLRTCFSSPLAALVSLFMFLFTDSCAVLSSSFIRVVWHFSLVPSVEFLILIVNLLSLCLQVVALVA